MIVLCQFPFVIDVYEKRSQSFLSLKYKIIIWYHFIETVSKVVDNQTQ